MTTCGCPEKAKDSVMFYAPATMSGKQSMTPEGYLVCYGVPIARTGTMLYGENEIPGMVARDGLITVERSPEEVFRAETMASFEGKPVTIDHPDDDVSPDNWHELTVGMMTNVRRGVGDEDNLLLADLVITARRGIKAVRDGKREVSCGYDTKFEQIEPGRGRQLNIIGNHVALVEKGRCGASCAIKDKENPKMTKPTFKEKIMAAFSLRDSDALEKVLSEGGDTTSPAGHGVTINLGDRKPVVKDAELEQLKADLKKANDTIAELKKAKDADEDEDDKKKAEDSDEDETDEDKKKKANDALFEGGGMHDADTLYSELVSRAEILAPGVQMKKINSKIVKDSAKVTDALCIIKRDALNASLISSTGREALKPFLNGRTVDQLTCSAVDAAFIGASEIVKAANNAKANPTTKDGSKVADAWTKNGIDAVNKEFWAPKTSK